MDQRAQIATASRRAEVRSGDDQHRHIHEQDEHEQQRQPSHPAAILAPHGSEAHGPYSVVVEPSLLRLLTPSLPGSLAIAALESLSLLAARRAVGGALPWRI